MCFFELIESQIRLMKKALNSKDFLVASLSFGISFIVILIAWCIIMSLVFKWRPKHYVTHMISNTLKVNYQGSKYYAYLTMWWVFYLFPFIISLAAGIYISVIFEPVIVGISVALIPSAILFLQIAYKNYSHNGYRRTSSTFLYIILSFILIFANTAAAAFTIKSYTWTAAGYFFTFPSLVIYMLLAAHKRLKLTKEAVTKILSSEEEKRDFAKEIGENVHGEYIEGNGKIGIVNSIIVFVTSIIFNGIYIIIFFKKKEKMATITTSIAFTLIDMTILTAQFLSKNPAKTINIILSAFIIKFAIISFTANYYIVSHGILFFVFGTYFLQRFLHWLFLVTVKEYKTTNNTNLPDPVFEKLQHIRGVSVNYGPVEAFIGLVPFILLAILFAFELAYSDKEILESAAWLGFTQETTAYALIALTVAIALAVAAFRATQSYGGKMTLFMAIGEIASIILVPMFLFIYPSLTTSFDVKMAVSLIFAYVMCAIQAVYLYQGNGSTLKRGEHLITYILMWVFAVLTIVCVIILVVVPLVTGSRSLWGVIVILATTAFILYVTFLALFARQAEGKAKWIILGLLAPFLTSLMVCVWQFGLEPITVGVITTFLVCIMSYIFSIVYMISNLWQFSLGPMLVSTITSVILLGLSVTALLLTELKLLSIIVAFISAFILFGGMCFYFLQKRNMERSAGSIICAVLLAIVIIALAVLMFISIKDVFVSISGLFLICFVICVVGSLGYRTTTSKTNVLVFNSIFFPVRRYKKGKLITLSPFSVMFILSVGILWLWGLMCSAFAPDDVKPYGSLGCACSLVFCFYTMTYMLTEFDTVSLSVLSYLDEAAIKHAITKAMQCSLVIPGGRPEQPEAKTFEEFKELDDVKYRYHRSASYFESSFKAQLFIDAEVQLEDALTHIDSYLRSHNYDSSFLFRHKFDGRTRIYILELMKLVGAEDSKDDKGAQAKVKEYNDFVNKQEQSRMAALMTFFKGSSKDTVNDFKKSIASCSKSKKLFVDKDFYPSKKVNESRSSIMNDLAWKRANEVFKGKCFGKTTPDDILQGTLGDCYLVSSMTTIGRYSALVESMFEFPESIEHGGASINFNVLGEKKSVVIDTSVPVNAKSGKAKFCGPKDAEKGAWWCSLVEKAFAKQHGSYSAIIGGQSSTAFYRLLGGWPMCFELGDINVKEEIVSGALFQKLVRWQSEGALFCAGSNPGKDTQKNRSGIILGHSYSILRVEDINGTQLLQLRNPWGDVTWNGYWSPDSKMWWIHPNVRRAIGEHKDDPGCFWISFKDFVCNFSSLYCGIPITNTWVKSNIRSKLSPGSDDGAKPVTKNAPPADKLTQYLIRFPSSDKPLTVRATLEKAGSNVAVWVYIVKNKGKKISKITTGMKYEAEAIPANASLHSFEWEIEPQDTKEPWTLLVCRNKLSTATEFDLRLFARSRIEVTPMG